MQRVEQIESSNDHLAIVCNETFAWALRYSNFRMNHQKADRRVEHRTRALALSSPKKDIVTAPSCDGNKNIKASWRENEPARSSRDMLRSAFEQKSAVRCA